MIKERNFIHVADLTLDERTEKYYQETVVNK